VAAPVDQQQLRLGDEARQIEESLDLLQRKGLVVLDVLEHATKETLLQQLQKDYHIFHFIGHGDWETEGGALCLEDKGGCTDLLKAQDLSTLLADRQVRLAVLNACHTAAPSRTVLAWGVGPQLAHIGISAVIGMRSEIMDASAIAFARDLYTAIASGHLLEAALTEPRKGMMLETGRDCPEWSLPVLFIRTPDSLLVQPKAIEGDRRFLQFSLTTRLKSKRTRVPRPHGIFAPASGRSLGYLAQFRSVLKSKSKRI
jgi:hypothetical protein